MKLRIATIALPLALICSAAAYAETTATTTAATTTVAAPAMATTQTVLVSTILEKLNAAGYVGIRDIELEHGVYEVKAFNKDGHHFKLKIDPKTGEILHKPMNKPAPAVSMQQAALAVEKAGYTKIIEIECEHKYYEVKAHDADNKKVKLDVDKMTGAVTKGAWW